MPQNLRVDNAFENMIRDHLNQFVVPDKEKRKLQKAHVNSEGMTLESLVKRFSVSSRFPEAPIFCPGSSSSA